MSAWVRRLYHLDGEEAAAPCSNAVRLRLRLRLRLRDRVRVILGLY